MIRTFFLDSTNRLRTAWRFLAFGLSFLFGVFVLQILTAIGFVVYIAMTDVNFKVQRQDQVAQLFQDSSEALAAIVAAPMALLTVLLVFVWRRYLDRRTMASLGLTRLDWQTIKWLPVGFLLGMTPILAGTALLWAVGEYRFTGWSGSAMTAVIAPTLVLMAFEEEIICRGYLLQNLIDIRRTVFGVAFSSLVFWLLHGLNPHAWSSPWISINLFGAGIVLSLAYLASGNLWFPTVMHYAWNFAQGVLLSLPISGNKVSGMIGVESLNQSPEWLSGGSFGLEGSVIVTVMEIVLAGVLGCAIVIKRRRQPAAELAPAAEPPLPLEATPLSVTPENSAAPLS